MKKRIIKVVVTYEVECSGDKVDELGKYLNGFVKSGYGLGGSGTSSDYVYKMKSVESMKVYMDKLLYGD